MSNELSKVEADREALREANEKGGLAKLGTFVRLSGPGWLQSALTLGGGSLGSSLYLGILAGFSMMWLQPFAMILGIIMLSAIGYVTLSTGERPFQAINRHINPVLGWSWLAATLAANMVWSLPQYSLSFAVLEQNLFPEAFKGSGMLAGPNAPWIVSGVILAICTAVTWSYGSGSVGVKIYETVLKCVVAVIVACFIGVVVKLSLAEGGIDWSAIAQGLIPNWRHLFEPAATFTPLLEAIQDSAARQYWTERLVSDQRDVMISAAAAAVGINMTFLLPYSMLSRGWGKTFRGLAMFDLSTGMFIPFVLATGCVIIASASQFHTQPAVGLVEKVQLADGTPVTVGDDLRSIEEAVVKSGWTQEELAAYNAASSDEQVAMIDEVIAEKKDDKAYAALATGYRGILLARMQGAWTQSEKESLAALPDAKRTAEVDRRLDAYIPTLSRAERALAATLVRRDTSHLANSLSPLTGSTVANWIFGVGVVAMTMSSISLMMLISGFVVCEVANVPPKGWLFRFGCLASATGVLWPFFWAGGAKAWLTIVASVFGAMLLPIAYLTFYLMMNQRTLLGAELPTGVRRLRWNLLMAIATFCATGSSMYAVWKTAESNFGNGWYGMGVIAAFLALAAVVQVTRKPRET